MEGSNDSQITSCTRSVSGRSKFVAVFVHTRIVVDQELHGCKISAYRSEAQRRTKPIADRVDVCASLDDSAHSFHRPAENCMMQWCALHPIFVIDIRALAE
jgi:hypothetical protein